MHERPGTHVLGFLLQPHHFFGLFVTLEQRRQLGQRPGIELLHPDDGDLGRSHLVVGRDLVAPLGRFVGDLPAAQDDATYRGRVDDLGVVQNVGEGAGLEVLDR